MDDTTRPVVLDDEVADRSDVFYWQTDRAVEPAVAGAVWADRHGYFTDDDLVAAADAVLGDDPLVELVPRTPGCQTDAGNVNSVRQGRLTSGQAVVLRCHPRGVPNGYFPVESLAADRARAAGLPTYRTFALHDYRGDDDFAFQVIEQLPGPTMQAWLAGHPDSEDRLVHSAGALMRALHQVHVDGFGPFDLAAARRGELRGVHSDQSAALRAGLTMNLECLTAAGLLDERQCAGVRALMVDADGRFAGTRPVLVHNDFADWNLLCDGEQVTGILDWDEAVGADPAADVACWSTFFDPARLEVFLDGYHGGGAPADFAERFELFRLRYIVSKMTLRLRRVTWDPSPAVRDKIRTGTVHLAQSLAHFGL